MRKNKSLFVFLAGIISGVAGFFGYAYLLHSHVIDGIDTLRRIWRGIWNVTDDFFGALRWRENYRVRRDLEREIREMRDTWHPPQEFDQLKRELERMKMRPSHPFGSQNRSESRPSPFSRSSNPDTFGRNLPPRGSLAAAQDALEEYEEEIEEDHD